MHFNPGSKVTVILRDKLVHACIHGTIREYRDDYIEIEQLDGEPMLIPRESIVYVTRSRR